MMIDGFKLSTCVQTCWWYLNHESVLWGLQCLTSTPAAHLREQGGSPRSRAGSEIVARYFAAADQLARVASKNRTWQGLSGLLTFGNMFQGYSRLRIPESLGWWQHICRFKDGLYGQLSAGIPRDHLWEIATEPDCTHICGMVKSCIIYIYIDR